MSDQQQQQQQPNDEPECRYPQQLTRFPSIATRPPPSATGKASISLRPLVRRFLHQLQGLLRCRQSMKEYWESLETTGLAESMELIAHSGGISVDDDNNNNDTVRYYKARYQQESIKGKPVQNLNELYEAAQHIQPVFHQLLQKLCRSVSGLHASTSLVFPPPCKTGALKSKSRAAQKARQDYAHRLPGPPESWLYDIHRCTILSDTEDQLQQVAEWLQTHCHIVKAKNRFRNVTSSGGRHFLFVVELYGTATTPSDPEEAEQLGEEEDDANAVFRHACEIQVRYRPFEDLVAKGFWTRHSHARYEYWRSYFPGSGSNSAAAVEARLRDLETIAAGYHGDRVDETFFEGLLDHCQDVHRLECLANLLEETLGEYPAALQVRQKLLDMAKRAADADASSTSSSSSPPQCLSANLAKAHSELGSLLRKMGNYSASSEQHEMALKLKHSLYGRLHRSTAVEYSQIGNVLYYQGDYRSALRYYEESLAIVEQVLGPEDMDTATAYSMVGLLRFMGGAQYDDALAMYQQALEIRRTILGEDHAHTASSYSQIGVVYERQGFYETALLYYQRAMRIRCSVLGPHHAHTAVSYTQVASIYERQGLYRAALVEHAKALAIRQAVFGPRHARTASSYSKVASLLYAQGQYEEALQLHRQVLRFRQETLGEYHPDTATSHSKLGSIHHKQGRYDFALREYRTALEIRQVVWGSHHFQTVLARCKVALVHEERGDDSEALSEYQLALDHLQQGANNHRTTHHHDETPTIRTSRPSMSIFVQRKIRALVARRESETMATNAR